MSAFFSGLAAAIALWVFALLYLHSLIRRRTSPDHILSLLQEEVLQLEADIDEKTEQNLALLEEKIKTLRDLCTETERRIAVYNRELDRKNREEETFSLLSGAAAAKEGTKEEKKLPPAEAGTVLGLKDEKSPPQAVPPSAPPGPGKGRKKKGAQNRTARNRTAPALSGTASPALSASPAPSGFREALPEGAAGPSLPLLRGLEVREPDRRTAAADSAYRAQTRLSSAHRENTPAALPETPDHPSGETVFALPLAAKKPDAAEDIHAVLSAPDRTDGPDSRPALPRIKVSRELVPAPPPMKDRIAELYRAGFSSELIAERLGLAVGEVRLYIAMESPDTAANPGPSAESPGVGGD